MRIILIAINRKKVIRNIKIIFNKNHFLKIGMKKQHINQKFQFFNQEYFGDKKDKISF